MPSGWADALVALAVWLGVKACYWLKGEYGVLLSPLTPKMLHCDYGLQGIGEKTEDTFG